MTKAEYRETMIAFVSLAKKNAERDLETAESYDRERWLEGVVHGLDCALGTLEASAFLVEDEVEVAK